MEKDIQNRIDALLRTKFFSELSDDEKKLILENFESKESYDEFRKVIVEMNASASKVPEPGIKKDLMQRMKSKNKSSLISVFEFKTPLYANLTALSLVIVLFLVFRPIEEVIVQKTKTVEVASIPDTVYLEMEPDTVIQEKLIKVEVPVYLTTSETVEEKEAFPIEDDIEMNGSNLADHQVLRGLIASEP